MSENRGSDSIDATAAGPEDPSKRKLLELASIGVQAAVGLAIAIPWVGGFVSPLTRGGKEEKGAFNSVGRLARFNVDKPAKVVITGAGSDAWTHTKDVSMGAAWVVRRGETEFDVFSTTCPHLGCAVNFDESHSRFLCPCHGSHFEVSGSRIEAGDEPNPSPRDMDPLEWKIDSGELLVRYQRFKTGTGEREAVS